MVRLQPLGLFQKSFPHIEFPDFSKGHIHSGFRHKLSKRRPVYGFNPQGFYEVSGLYKNGFTLAAYLTKKLVEDLPPEQ